MRQRGDTLSALAAPPQSSIPHGQAACAMALDECFDLVSELTDTAGPISAVRGSGRIKRRKSGRGSLRGLPHHTIATARARGAEERGENCASSVRLKREHSERLFYVQPLLRALLSSLRTSDHLVDPPPRCSSPSTSASRASACACKSWPRMRRSLAAAPGSRRRPSALGGAQHGVPLVALQQGSHT